MLGGGFDCNVSERPRERFAALSGLVVRPPPVVDFSVTPLG